MARRELTRSALESGAYVGTHILDTDLTGYHLVRCVGFDENGASVEKLIESKLKVPAGSEVIRLDQEYGPRFRTGKEHWHDDPDYPTRFGVPLNPSIFLDAHRAIIGDHSAVLARVAKCYHGYSDQELESIYAYSVEKKLDTNPFMHGRQYVFTLKTREGK